MARADSVTSKAADELRRALAFLRRALAPNAEELHGLDAGLVVRTPSLPDVWSLNQLRLFGPVAAPELQALADAYLDGLPYRHVLVEDEATGRELEPELRAQGWKVDRLVLMALRGKPAFAVGSVAVIEPDEDEMLAIMGRWISEESTTAPGEIEQLIEVSRRDARSSRDHCFGVRADARLAAITKLRSDGQTAQLEDVYTVPEARGQGFASALVVHACAVGREAEHELIFIVADDNGWPKELYARLGFEPIGRLREFHREA